MTDKLSVWQLSLLIKRKMLGILKSNLINMYFASLESGKLQPGFITGVQYAST